MDHRPEEGNLPPQHAVADPDRQAAYDAATDPHGMDPVTGEVVDGGTPRKTFASFVIEQRNGALHAEASEVLAELVKAVQDHNKAGSVTIKITVKPGSKGTNTLVVSDDVTIKAPTGDRPAALFFPDEHGNLHRSDPRQQQFPMRRVEVGPPGPLRRPGGGDA
jgi:hypothetical protein